MREQWKSSGRRRCSCRSTAVCREERVDRSLFGLGDLDVVQEPAIRCFSRPLRLLEGDARILVDRAARQIDLSPDPVELMTSFSAVGGNFELLLVAAVLHDNDQIDGIELADTLSHQTPVER